MFVEDALYVVENGTAQFVQDSPAVIANGGFEKYDGDHLTSYNFHDKPGEVSFVDSKVYSGGRASLRFENFGRYEHGHARVMQEVEVEPNRCYRLTCMVRAESLEPEGCFRVQVLAMDGRSLAPWDPKVPSTTDWRKVVMGFNSLDYDKVRIYLGAWGGVSGRFWVDDLNIEEVGLLNVLRRPGTPVRVRSERTGRQDQERPALAGQLLPRDGDQPGPGQRVYVRAGGLRDMGKTGPALARAACAEEVPAEYGRDKSRRRLSGVQETRTYDGADTRRLRDATGRDNPQRQSRRRDPDMVGYVRPEPQRSR